MIGASLIASTPFRNPTAFRDVAGLVALIHQNFAETIRRTTGQAVALYPLGNGLGEDAWLFALTRQHEDESRVLGIEQPPAFTDFNLRDASEFASFMFLLANDLERIRLAAGVV